MPDLMWEGKKIETLGDLMKVIDSITTSEKAAEFMALYRAESQHADQNIGYLCGYLDPKEANEKLALFKTAHPIFGTNLTVLSPADALQAGVDAAHHQRSNDVMATIDPDASE